MIKLYYAPLTRSFRILWLLEELGTPYELERMEFRRTASKFFVQQTPTGKLPTLEDGDVVMCESGAIAEYLVERYGEGRLAPPIGSPERGRYLQWLHFAESTAYPPLGIVIWLTRYREQGEVDEGLLEDARKRARAGLAFLERGLADGPYLLGDAFSAADVMMGFTVVAAQVVGLLDERFPALAGYMARLRERPAFQRALAVG